jgi:hypothetical protein
MRSSSFKSARLFDSRLENTGISFPAWKSFAAIDSWIQSGGRSKTGSSGRFSPGRIGSMACAGKSKPGGRRKHLAAPQNENAA